MPYAKAVFVGIALAMAAIDPSTIDARPLLRATLCLASVAVVVAYVLFAAQCATKVPAVPPPFAWTVPCPPRCIHAVFSLIQVFLISRCRATRATAIYRSF
jgi:hypothetical protein